MWWKSKFERDKPLVDRNSSRHTLEKKRTVGAYTQGLVRLGVGCAVRGGVGRAVLVLEDLFGRHNEEGKDEWEFRPSVLLYAPSRSGHT